MTKTDLIRNIDKSLREFGFPKSIYNRLYLNNIFTVSELLKLTEIDLMKIKSLGSKKINEIKYKLKAAGFVLHNPNLGALIEELELSERSFNALKRAGIDLIEEIAFMKDVEMFKIRGIGFKSILEIKKSLKLYVFEKR